MSLDEMFNYDRIISSPYNNWPKSAWMMAHISGRLLDLQHGPLAVPSSLEMQLYLLICRQFRRDEYRILKYQLLHKHDSNLTEALARLKGRAGFPDRDFEQGWSSWEWDGPCPPEIFYSEYNPFRGEYIPRDLHPNKMPQYIRLGCRLKADGTRMSDKEYHDMLVEHAYKVTGYRGLLPPDKIDVGYTFEEIQAIRREYYDLTHNTNSSTTSSFTSTSSSHLSQPSSSSSSLPSTSNTSSMNNLARSFANPNATAPTPRVQPNATINPTLTSFVHYAHPSTSHNTPPDVHNSSASVSLDHSVPVTVKDSSSSSKEEPKTRVKAKAKAKPEAKATNLNADGGISKKRKALKPSPLSQTIPLPPTDGDPSSNLDTHAYNVADYFLQVPKPQYPHSTSSTPSISMSRSTSSSSWLAPVSTPVSAADVEFGPGPGPKLIPDHTTGSRPSSGHPISANPYHSFVKSKPQQQNVGHADKNTLRVPRPQPYWTLPAEWMSMGSPDDGYTSGPLTPNPGHVVGPNAGAGSVPSMVGTNTNASVGFGASVAPRSVSGNPYPVLQPQPQPHLQSQPPQSYLQPGQLPPQLHPQSAYSVQRPHATTMVTPPVAGKHVFPVNGFIHHHPHLAPTSTSSNSTSTSTPLQRSQPPLQPSQPILSSDNFIDLTTLSPSPPLSACRSSPVEASDEFDFHWDMPFIPGAGVGMVTGSDGMATGVANGVANGPLLIHQQRQQEMNGKQRNLKRHHVEESEEFRDGDVRADVMTKEVDGHDGRKKKRAKVEGKSQRD